MMCYVLCDVQCDIGSDRAGDKQFQTLIIYWPSSPHHSIDPSVPLLRCLVHPQIGALTPILSSPRWWSRNLRDEMLHSWRNLHHVSRCVFPLLEFWVFEFLRCQVLLHTLQIMGKLN
jgi:hypothetical protein